MEIRELRYILAIAKHQNLTKAAEELFISQSALTKFLHKYEEENNLTLFIKVGNRFILSENGKVFVKKADEILRMHDLFYSGSVVKTKIQAFYNEPISVAELGRCPR